MLVSVNLSKEVYEYFREYDLSQVVDKLLEMYDFTNLPPITGTRYKEVKVNITNTVYIETYNMLGARSKKVSLGRLFEFAYNMDVLALPRFQAMRDITLEDPTDGLLQRAYKALLDARKYDESSELKDITQLVRAYISYRKKLREEIHDGRVEQAD